MGWHKSTTITSTGKARQELLLKIGETREESAFVKPARLRGAWRMGKKQDQETLQAP